MEKEQSKLEHGLHWQQTPGYDPVPPLYGKKPAPPAHDETPDEILEAKHNDSVRRYPLLGLSKDEYVVLEVRRHPIGLVSIWIIVAIVLVAVFALLPLYSLNTSAIANTLLVDQASLPSPAVLTLPLLLLVILFMIGGYIATFVYQSNRFYLTNESVIQTIQLSLFAKKEQRINLANIEDASYKQEGILQHIFGYGTLRLSTQGEETIYRFYFVANPRSVVQEIMEAMEDATGHAARFRHNSVPPIKLERY